ncbi:MAG: hypothetical protein AAB421_03060 [Patescibacteria group bacterium]
MHRALKWLVILGLVAAGLAMAMPFIAGFLMEILCGGVVAIVGPAAYIGNFLGPVAGGGTVAFLVGLVIWIGYLVIRYVRKRKKDATIINTVENALHKNIAYVKSARAEGMSDVQIRTVFHNGGWSAEETDKVFALAA